MKQRLRNGIPLRRINVTIAVIAGVLAMLLFAVTYQTLVAFRRMQDASDQHLEAHHLVSDLQEATGYLTDRVRTFVTTGHPDSLNDYFVEKEQTQRREKVRSDIQKLIADTEAAAHLEEALALSDELVPVEYTAMRLAAEVYHVPIDGYPALLAVTLTEEEQAMTDEEKLAHAQMMLYDEHYQSMRGRIVGNISACEETMLNDTAAQQKKASKQFEQLLVEEAFLVAAELLLMLVLMFAVRFMVIEPMESVVQAIAEERTVPSHQGAHELRFLSRAYNTMFEQLDWQREELFYRVSHDHLTGLYNRSVFDKIRDQNERRAYSMILADVDHFKTINDTYGHSIGDQVLQKVARAMQTTFRSEDYVCRIGGDEFAVIMVHTDSSFKALVQRKVKEMAAMLRDTSDGLPLLTLSVGVAFSDTKEPDHDLYKDADAALYIVKEHGHDGVVFYTPDGGSPEG